MTLVDVTANVKAVTVPGLPSQREGDMSEEELKQCVLDMETWLACNAEEPGKIFGAAPGATADEISTQLPTNTPATLRVRSVVQASLSDPTDAMVSLRKPPSPSSSRYPLTFPIK